MIEGCDLVEILGVSYILIVNTTPPQPCLIVQSGMCFVDHNEKNCSK